MDNKKVTSALKIMKEITTGDQSGQRTLTVDRSKIDNDIEQFLGQRNISVIISENSSNATLSW